MGLLGAAMHGLQLVHVRVVLYKLWPIFYLCSSIH